MSSMKRSLLALALLGSKVFAAPLDPRALVTETFTKTEWVTVGVVATVWINDADPSATPSLAPLSAPVAQPTSAITTAAPVPASSAPAPSAPAASAPVSSAPSTSAAAAPSPAPVASSSSAAPAPAVSPAGFAAVAAVATTAAAPAPATSSSATVAAAKPVSASTSGTCEGPGNACTGDVTYYDGGLGACGWNVDSSTELSIALPVGFMGSQSNGNPYCGRSVTVLNPTTGVSVKAKVGDKCMGCTDRAIDLTNALFKAVVPNGDGRVHGIQWWLD